ncbi:MAG TPA: HypC/HybG/HupF family hydrogenase formation chaperone [Micromonosporaceae bacterium]|nr:HypC/HybG/HupF family hydrogenase formation chaperone [Micromonosporaceae bacterium]
MCLAYPARVRSVGDGTAQVDAGGRTQEVILLALDGGEPAAGDWLLVQSGIALARIDPGEAAARARALAQITEGAP